MARKANILKNFSPEDMETVELARNIADRFERAVFATFTAADAANRNSPVAEPYRNRSKHAWLGLADSLMLFLKESA